MKKIVIEGKFQCKKENFGFLIPDNRSEWGGDFFVSNKNFADAVDGDRVKAQVLERTTGKKPEVKILEVISGKKKPERETLKVIEGIFSGGSGDFGFVDVAEEGKWYFCYGLKRNGAQDGDRVKAEVKKYNGKDEAIVVEILSQSKEIFEGIYSDNESFGFVRVSGRKEDIFIPWGKSLEAQNGDKVQVKIVKQGGRRPEGVIIQKLK